MSTESELNAPNASVVETAAPTAEYVPMADPIAADEPKRKTYDGNDAETIREAAADLDKARAENRIPRAEDEPVDRGYKYLTGDRAGEAVEPEQTLTAERSARDLRMVREWEAASQQPQPADEAAAIDALRAANNGQQPQAEAPSEFNDKARADLAAEQQQSDIDPEIAQALSNPKIRAALEAEVNAAEQSRAQYAQATRQAAQLSAAALLSFAPELNGINAENIPGALALIAKTNPARAMEIEAQYARTKALLSASQQAERAQQQIQAQRAATQQQQLRAWVAAEEAKFTAATANESPETMRKLAENVVALAEEYGVSKQELAQVWQSQPVLRSAAFQRIMVDAARFRMAQREAATKISKPVPPVQRPGVSQPRGVDSGVEAAMRAFRQNPGPQTGAALLHARRNSR